MANALKKEENIYKYIKDQSIYINPVIWALLNHHIRNDLQVMMLGADETREILNEALSCLESVSAVVAGRPSNFTGKICLFLKRLLKRISGISRPEEVNMESIAQLKRAAKDSVNNCAGILRRGRSIIYLLAKIKACAYKDEEEVLLDNKLARD